MTVCCRGKNDDAPTLDALVSALIDAGLAPTTARVSGLSCRSLRLEN